MVFFRTKCMFLWGYEKLHFLRKPKLLYANKCHFLWRIACFYEKRYDSFKKVMPFSVENCYFPSKIMRFCLKGSCSQGNNSVWFELLLFLPTILYFLGRKKIFCGKYHLFEWTLYFSLESRTSQKEEGIFLIWNILRYVRTELFYAVKIFFHRTFFLCED